MPNRLTFLLLQVRNEGDPMATHEVRCFAQALGCRESRITVHDLLGGGPSPAQLRQHDLVLLGGSGDYSVSQGGSWLGPALDTMRALVALNKPPFASCWGFQAMARALGGEVIKDISRAEVGTRRVSLTEAGLADPVFGAAGPSFDVQMGHEDIVERLPEGTVLLASSDRVRNQAFRCADKPIYCTQFHPELDANSLLDRLRTYPKYIREITGLDYDEFSRERVRESSAASQLLHRFVQFVLATGSGAADRPPERR